MIDSWDDDIEYIIENSSRVKKVTDQAYSEWKYYNEYYQPSNMDSLLIER